MVEPPSGRLLSKQQAWGQFWALECAIMEFNDREGQ
jgi:hypothetical protein